MHDWHTGTEGSFAQTVQGLRHARAERIPAGVTVVITRPSFRHLTEIVRVAHAAGAVAIHFAPVQPRRPRLPGPGPSLACPRDGRAPPPARRGRGGAARPPGPDRRRARARTGSFSRASAKWSLPHRGRRAAREASTRRRRRRCSTTAGSPWSSTRISTPATRSRARPTSSSIAPTSSSSTRRTGASAYASRPRAPSTRRSSPGSSRTKRSLRPTAAASPPTSAPTSRASPPAPSPAAAGPPGLDDLLAMDIGADTAFDDPLGIAAELGGEIYQEEGRQARRRPRPARLERLPRRLHPGRPRPQTPARTRARTRKGSGPRRSPRLSKRN